MDASGNSSTNVGAIDIGSLRTSLNASTQAVVTVLQPFAIESVLFGTFSLLFIFSTYILL
ncbi:hypothetical protein OF83DRAFT_1288984 [Amylostereum chailletii]|nr:hypothetical protein OF83DRAFT_1288984 [Amylostereum chailletii]